MKITLKSIVLLVACLTQQLMADTVLGIHLSATSWQVDNEGIVTTALQPSDLDALLADGENAQVLTFKLEHPLPGLPNIGFSRSDFDTNGENQGIFSSLSSTHDEVLLYYELLDNWVSLDLGVSLMQVQDSFAIGTANSLVRTSVDEYLAGGYAMVQFDFPTTNLYLTGTLTLADMSDYEVSRQSIGLGWEGDWGLGVELGYKRSSRAWENIQLSDADYDLDGYYASLKYHF